MTDRTKKRLQSNTTSTKKLVGLLLSLFGKKTKKSFQSVISHLVETYEKEHLISFEEKKMIKNIASLSDKKVSGIMTPRADLIAIKHDADLEEIKKIIVGSGHTRIPVFKDTLDEIIGFIHVKDLSKFICDEDAEFSMNKIMRKILFVPGSMKILDLLLRMRMARVHVAIVLDEFGGVDGFVTIENVMEEIVGDIEDEHDLPSENAFFRIKKINNATFQFGGRVEIAKVEDILQTEIRNEGDSFETIAGLVMSMFKRIPETNEEIEKNNLRFRIISSDNRSIKMVEITKINEN